MYLFSFLIVVCRKGKRILIERKQSSLIFSFFVVGFRDCYDTLCKGGYIDKMKNLCTITNFNLCSSLVTLNSKGRIAKAELCLLEKGIKLRSKVLPYIGHNGGRLFSHKSSDLHNLSGNLFPAKVRANPPSKPVDTPPPQIN